MSNLCENCRFFNAEKALEMSRFKLCDYRYFYWLKNSYPIHDNYDDLFGIKKCYYFDYDDIQHTPGNKYVHDYLNCAKCLYPEGEFSKKNAEDKVNTLIGSNDSKFILPSLIEDKINDENSKFLYKIKRYTLYLLMLEKKYKEHYFNSKGTICLYYPDIVTICSLHFHLKSKLLFINNPDIFNIVCEFIGGEYEQSKKFTPLEWEMKKDNFVVYGDNMDLHFLNLFNKK
jgi:hypothetical protein